VLSKKWTIQLLIVGNLAIAFACFAEATPTQSNALSQKKSETIPYNLHEESDKTDIYDLPVQNDEESIEEEMEALKNEEVIQSNKKK